MDTARWIETKLKRQARVGPNSRLFGCPGWCYSYRRHTRLIGTRSHPIPKVEEDRGKATPVVENGKVPTIHSKGKVETVVPVMR